VAGNGQVRWIGSGQGIGIVAPMAHPVAELGLEHLPLLLLQIVRRDDLFSVFGLGFGVQGFGVQVKDLGRAPK